LLNKLNWTFSQCVSTLQEIQAFAINSDRPSSSDANQAKLCCACFELCLALLRVLEMILHYNAKLILAIHCGETTDDRSASAQSESPPTDSGAFGELLSRLSEKVQQMSETDHYLAESLNTFDSITFEERLVDASKSTEMDSELEEQRSLERQCENHVLLRQLCCTVNQILNRVTMGSGCFAYVQQIAGVKMINEFSILSAVTALLVELIVRNESTRKLTLHALVSEPSFQLQSFLYLIGGQSPKLNQSTSRSKVIGKDIDSSELAPIASGSSDDPGLSDELRCNSLRLLAMKTNDKYKFNFADYAEDMRSSEFEQVNKLLIYIGRYHEKSEKYRWADEIHEDDICTICYACKKTARFVPCNHQSCK
jgi:hypothetical protein